MNILRTAPLLIAALALSACAGAAPPEALGRYGVREQGAAIPLASLPASAGRVVAVRNRDYANGLSQEVVLDGPRNLAGENRITVEAVTGPEAVGGVARGNVLVLGRPTASAVAAEAEALFPGLSMRVATEIEHNAQGPFGYAAGTARGLACVYAWQYLVPDHVLSLLEGASGTGVHPVSVRVRLCRKAPVADLVEDLRGLSVTRPGNAGAEPLTASIGGDALDAALGPGAQPPPALPPRAGPGRDPDAAIPSPRPRRMARHAPRTLLARRPHGPARRSAPVVGSTPRLPMPDDVGSGAAPVPSMAVPARADGLRAASAGDTAMPMPR